MVIRLNRTPVGMGTTATKGTRDRQQPIWLVLLTVAILLRDIVMLPMPDIVFTGLCALAFLFLSNGAAMGVYMFTSALSVPDFEIRIVYLVVLLVKMWLRRGKLHAPMLLVVLSLVLLEMVNVSLFSGQSFIGVLYTVVMRLTYLALPLFWFSEGYSKRDYYRALLCYLCGVLLGGGVLLYMSVESVGWEVLLSGANVRLGLNTADDYQTQSQIRTGYNANQLGTMFVIAMAIVLVFADRKYMSKLWGFLLVPVSLFMVLLTKSREGILLSIAVVICYYFILLFRRKKVFSGTLFLAVFVALLYAMSVWFPEVVEGLLDRFRDPNNRTGGRDELFAQYMAAWLENVWVFLFGYGIGSYTQMVSISNVPHNFLADIVISWGLMGLLLIGYILVKLFKRGSAGIRKKDRLLAYLPALTAFFGVFGGQYISTGYPHMRLCFLLLAVKAFADDSQDAHTNTQRTEEIV